MDDFVAMLQRVLPWNWTLPKFASALLLALIVYAWMQIRRRKVTRHGVIMTLTWAFLLSISVHGVVTRGVFGTLSTEAHTHFYIGLASVHLTSGAIYFLLGFFQVFTGLFPKYSGRVFRWHRGVGRAAASCGILSIVCLLFLK